MIISGQIIAYLLQIPGKKIFKSIEIDTLSTTLLISIQRVSLVNALLNPDIFKNYWSNKLGCYHITHLRYSADEN